MIDYGMIEIGKCPVCTTSTRKVNWYKSDFWGDGNVTKTGDCTQCGTKLYKCYKFTGIEKAD